MRVGPRRRIGAESPAWIASLADGGVRAGLAVVGLAAVGLAALALAWKGAAATLEVWQQLPFVVSGAVGGLALTGFCLGLLAVHAERRAAAGDRQWLESAIADAAETAEILGPTLAARARPVPALVTNGRTVHRPECRIAAGRNLAPAPAGQAEGLRSCKVCRPPR